MRLGGKLCEELLIGDNVEQILLERIMTANEIMLPFKELNVFIDALDISCHNFEHEKFDSYY